MGIYIPNEKMPDCCENCFISNCKADIGYTYSGKRSRYCKIIEVKPHGRLIDADEAAKKIWEDMKYPSELANAQFFVNELREMPTIIEAEGR